MRAFGFAVLGLLVLGVLVVAVTVGLYFHYDNKEVRLRNAIPAQQKSNEAVFDTVWKTISQQAQVADSYKESFRQIYADIMTARYSGARGGALMSFIKEANPKFSPALFGRLMTTIEGQRKDFLIAQQKLIDLKREHDNCLQTAPSRWVVGGRPPVEIVIVTSTRTADAFEAGKDDDVNVFQKATPPAATPPTAGKK